MAFWLSWFASGVEQEPTATRESLRSVRFLLVVTASLLLAWLLPSAIWQVVLLANIAATIALLFHQAADPSPLFWAAPWEALQLLRNRGARVNHVWLHHTQELVQEATDSESASDGAASSQGFLLIANGFSEEEIRRLAEASWQTMLAEFPEGRSSRGCKAVRFLLTVGFVACGLLILAAIRGLDLSRALLCMAVCSAAGHGLAGWLESGLFAWASLVPFHEARAGREHFVVERIEFPAFLWFKRRNGFWVQRVDLGVRQASEIEEHRPEAAMEATAR